MAGPAPLLSARGITKSFGGRTILDGLDLSVADGARIGVLGPNGSGKSTLLGVLARAHEADAGEVTSRRDLVMAHLPQIIPGDIRSAVATVLDARPELRETEADLAVVEGRLSDAGTSSDMRALERALAHQERLLERWTAIGGGGAEGEARSILRSLGLDDGDLDAPTETLSGGQRKLVALAACLARRPRLLLLDEPEAHLDMSRRAVLERLLNEFGGAGGVVSPHPPLPAECVRRIAAGEGGKPPM